MHSDLFINATAASICCICSKPDRTTKLTGKLCVSLHSWRSISSKPYDRKDGGSACEVRGMISEEVIQTSHIVNSRGNCRKTRNVSGEY